MSEHTVSRRSTTIPFVQQLEATDCGPASLAMVLAYHGHHASLEDVRKAAGGSQRGMNAATVISTAEKFGLRGRGVSIDVSDLDYVPGGSILHWEFNHFVVFERVRRGRVEVVDPAVGRRSFSYDEVGRSFTGIVLILEPAEKFVPLQRTRRGGRFAEYMRPQRRVLTRVLITSILLRIFALAFPVVIGLIVDQVLPHRDWQLLQVISLGIGALLVFQFATTLIRSHLLLQVQTNLDAKLTLGFVTYMAALPYSFFQGRSAGDLMMRVNSNTTIRELLTTNTLSALIDGLLVVGYGVLVMIVSPLVGTIVLGLAGFQSLVFVFSRRRFHELSVVALQSQARTQSQLVELITGIETLKATASEARIVERWSNLYVDELNVALRRGRLNALLDSATNCLGLAAPIIVLVVASTRVLSGFLTVGEMFAVNALSVGILNPIGSLVNSALQLQLVDSYVERLDDVLRTPPERSGEAVEVIEGGLELNSVSFRYGDTEPFAVSNVSVSIRPGMRVAVVGRSGCGKSTLARLIAGLHTPQAGEIRFDGADFLTLNPRTLRSKLGVVFQQPHLFHGSIRSNIALAAPLAQVEAVVWAARMAAIHDDIESMPMKYETLLANAGSGLSGGQRQRIALARALVHSPQMLILDEATSALDGETERAVIRNLASLTCTQIVIAHRLSTIVDSDLILMMSNGEIVERGTHQQLLDCKGAYAQLVASQLQSPNGSRR